MSAVAGNALAVLKGNLRVAHGEEMAPEVSDFALVDEAAEVYPGMMMAVPPAGWPELAGAGAAEVVRLLNEVAARVPVHRMFRCRRGPKKPRPKRSRGNRIHHVSNKKLLDRRGVLALRHAGVETSPPQGLRINSLSCSRGWVMGTDRLRDWKWSAPDMVAELNSGAVIKPPVPQAESSEQAGAIAA